MKTVVIILSIVVVLLLISNGVLLSQRKKNFQKQIPGRSGGKTPEPFERGDTTTPPANGRRTGGECLCYGNIWHVDCCKKGNA